MFGFRIIKEVDEVEYSNFITKCNETGLNMHFVRTDSLNLTSIANCGLSQEYKSLMLQPLQAYLFDGNTVIFFVANCLVPPKLPNLNWNHNNKFDSFPPKNTINIDSLNISLSNFNSLNEIITTESTSRYTYIVNCSFFMERQSTKLIDMVKYNIKQFNLSDSTLLILNNTDDIMIKYDL